MFTKNAILIFLSFNLMSGAVLSGTESESCQGPDVCSKPALNILLLGKSGVGKSTVANILYNHIKENEYSSKDREIIIPLLHRGKVRMPVNVEAYKAYNVKLNARGRSQTIEVHQYAVENKYHNVIIWDVPGFIDTDGGLTDAENAKKIANALSDVSVHAVVIVLDAKDQDRALLESNANINNIRRMLPKSFSENLIAIFNRAASLNREDRKELTSWFGELFEMRQAGITPKAYFIDGSSFFDSITDFAQEELEMGEVKWKADGITVARMLSDIEKNTPADGKEAKKIQEKTQDLEDKVQSLNQEMLSLQAQILGMKIAAVDLRNSEANRDANQNFSKQREVPVEVNDVVWSGWWIFGCAENVKRIKNELVKYIDEGQQSEYLKALAAVQTYQEKQVSLAKEIKRLEAEQVKKLREVADIQKAMEALAMTTNLDPYIKYLEEQMRSAKASTSLTPEERDTKVMMFNNWLDVYKKMREHV